MGRTPVALKARVREIKIDLRPQGETAPGGVARRERQRAPQNEIAGRGGPQRRAGGGRCAHNEGGQDPTPKRTYRQSDRAGQTPLYADTWGHQEEHRGSLLTRVPRLHRRGQVIFHCSKLYGTAGATARICLSRSFIVFYVELSIINSARLS